jgi:hypothetical protein
MADDGSRTAGEYGRRLLRQRRKRNVSDRVDPSVQAVKTASGDAPRDRTPAQTDMLELLPRDDAALSGGESRYRSVDVAMRFGRPCCRRRSRRP